VGQEATILANLVPLVALVMQVQEVVVGVLVEAMVAMVTEEQDLFTEVPEAAVFPA
jgi:hypothetical protein